MCPATPHPATSRSGMNTLTTLSMGEAAISATGEIHAVCPPLVSALSQWCEVGNDPVCILSCGLVQLQS